MSMLSPDGRIFLRKFVRYPKQVGSAVPSSRFLAKKMAGAVPWNEVRAAAELGAGTGAITRVLAERVRPGTDVYLFEKDADMRRRLADRYPGFTCAANAACLLDVVGGGGSEGEGEGRLDCVLSGLPFFNFTQELRDRILGQVEQALKPGGLFVAFQYSLQMRGQLSRRFEIERIGFTPLNVPPAFVYVCRKRGGSPC